MKRFYNLSDHYSGLGRRLANTFAVNTVIIIQFGDVVLHNIECQRARYACRPDSRVGLGCVGQIWGLVVQLY